MKRPSLWRKTRTEVVANFLAEWVIPLVCLVAAFAMGYGMGRIS